MYIPTKQENEYTKVEEEKILDSGVLCGDGEIRKLKKEEKKNEDLEIDSLVLWRGLNIGELNRPRQCSKSTASKARSTSKPSPTAQNDPAPAVPASPTTPIQIAEVKDPAGTPKGPRQSAKSSTSKSRSTSKPSPIAKNDPAPAVTTPPSPNQAQSGVKALEETRNK